MHKISVVIPVYNLAAEVVNMLKSVKLQSFADFEAIVIDDGSLDNSYEIIRDYIGEDKRFTLIKQENSGVSAARNCGLDMAKGDYIIFFDGDDYIPPDALKKMYKAITSADADMTVGIMTTYSDGNFALNKSSQKLAAKNNIKPQDIEFIKTWSQCNKMYRTKFIKNNNIKFKDIRVAEDGDFLYQVLAAFPKICGCNHVVYHYIRRPFWTGEHTASKNVNLQYLYDRNTAYEGILENAELLLGAESLDRRTEYMDKLVGRFIQGGIIQAFYKRIWRCEKEIEKELYNLLCIYKEMISVEAWEIIKSKDWEIELENRIMNGEDDDFRKSIVQSPIVSVIISTQLGRDELNLTLMSLYNQEFPAFEVLVGKDSFELLDDYFRQMNNLRCVDAHDVDDKNVAADKVFGKYLYFVDEAVIIGTHGFKIMSDKLRNNNNYDFIAAYMKGIKKSNWDKADGYSYRLKTMDTVFGYSDREKYKTDKINALDNFFINKLFNAKCFEKFNFSNKDVEDINILYNNGCFEKTRAAEVLTFKEDKDFAVRSCHKPGEVQCKLRYLKNKMIEPMAGKGIKKLLKKYLH